MTALAALDTQVIQEFEKRFGEAPPIIVRAPGRVNLIGEHTDYNDGFVLPMAIDRATWIALRPRNDLTVNLYSINLDEASTFDLLNLSREREGYQDYIEGVAWSLQQRGYPIGGFDGVLVGDVPIGAGLSSSAALELAAARAFSEIAPFDWNAVEMAKLAQIAENQWVGMNSGIMDQLISSVGRRNYAVMIDCRSLETYPAVIPQNTAVVVLDTGTRRELVGGAYNERRQQCESAAQFFGVPALRDVTFEQFQQRADQLDPLVRKRAHHVITENDRTQQAYQSMENNNPQRLGQLMNASHDSLRDDFEVSSDALNIMVDIARKQPGCYGARMTGAGFGGCAVALIDEAVTADFVSTVSREYDHQTSNQSQLYVCYPAEGASVERNILHKKA
jgi:galactokinase